MLTTTYIGLITGCLGLQGVALTSTPVIPMTAAGLWVALSLGVAAILINIPMSSCQNSFSSGKVRKELMSISIVAVALTTALTFCVDYTSNISMVQLVQSGNVGRVSKESKVVILDTILKYSKNNPARAFLSQYYLLPKKDGNSKFVWGIVKSRAAYVSKLYKDGLLPENATMPNFGFLHVNKKEAHYITEQPNKLHAGDVSEFYSKRRLGYSVRCANNILTETRSEIMRGHPVLGSYSHKLSYLESINTAPNAIHIKMLRKEESALGVTGNADLFYNMALGGHKSPRSVLREVVGMTKIS
jgi:hypothetical protein